MVKEIDCWPRTGGAAATAKDCCMRGARSKSPLPGCSASTVQVPTPVGTTRAPETLQTPPLPAPVAKLTGRPELATAATAYAGPPATALAGGVDVNTIAWDARTTGIACCARASLYLALPACCASTRQVPV